MNPLTVSGFLQPARGVSSEAAPPASACCKQCLPAHPSRPKYASQGGRLAATISNTNVRAFGCGGGSAHLGAWPRHGFAGAWRATLVGRSLLSLFSTPKQLARLQRVLFMCLRLPFSQGAIPGRVLEEVLAEVRSARVLPTYDFVDVVSAEEACGWQVKSTRAATPVTWKRAKLPNATELIDASMESEAACQELGDAIIGLCNEHAQHSLTEYELDEIGFSK